MVHPQCRGYIHRTAFIFNSLQTTQFWSAHSAADLLNNPKLCSNRTFLLKPSAHSTAEVVHALSWDLTLTPKPSAHSAAEVVHAHSWDLTLNPKIGLSFFASNYHHTKTFEKALSPLHKCLFILVHYYNTMYLNHEFKPWVIYKKRGFDPTPKPLRLFWTATLLTSFAPKLQSCQN